MPISRNISQFKEYLISGKVRSIFFKCSAACIVISSLLSLFSNIIFLPLFYHAAALCKLEHLQNYFKPALNFSWNRVFFFFILFLLLMSIYLFGLENILRYRYLVAAILFFLLVSGKFTGSSIGAFDQMLYGNTSAHTDTTILGRAQGIRADEWAIEKPYYFAQAAEGVNQPYYNYNLMIDGADMVIMAFSPVRDIIMSARPALLGFLFLPVEYTFSFYWNFRLIFLFLSTFELGLLLLNNKKISFCVAIALTWSAPVQWLFSQWLIDIIISGQYAVVFWNYLLASNTRKEKLLYSILLGCACNMYIYVMYPAAQIPFFYIFISMAIYIMWKYRAQKPLSRRNWPWFVIVFFLISSMALHFLYMSRDALTTMLNTVYPGGGDREWGTFAWDYELLPFMNLLTGIYKDSPYLNNCETAQFVYFLPFQLACIPFIVRNKRKDSKTLCLFMIGSVSLILYLLAKLPKQTLLSDILLLGMSYPRRLHYALGFGFFWTLWIIVCILFLHTKEKASFRISKSFSIFCTVVTLFAVIYSDTLRQYFGIGSSVTGTVTVILLCLGFGYMGYLLLFYQKQNIRKFIIIYLIITIASTLFVNPLSCGMDSIYEKTSLEAVRQISARDKDGRWMISGNAGIGNLVSAQGVKRCSGYYYYPDISMMKLIDPEETYVNLWNSFTAVDMRLTEGNNHIESPENNVAITAYINLETAKKLNIRYVFDMGTISDEFLSSGNLEIIYIDPVDNVTIYKINYQ